MRTLTLFVAFSALQISAQEPRIWGMTTSGGANNKGTIFAVDADGTDFTMVHDFDETSGWNAEGGLCLAPNGLLYGLTAFGGEATPAAGTLFTVDPATGTFTKIRDFDITNGGFNQSTLIVGADGMLYGAGYGGSDGGGSIYRIDPATNVYTELYALDQATDGGAINSRLLQTADGMLYGTASQGGANGESGTVFSYDPVADVYTKLHDFDGADGGRTPYGGLCAAANGWLYGTTFEGGADNHGIVYKYDPVNGVFEKLMDLDAVGGSNCWNTMANAGSDLLMGAVASGGLNSGGFVFSLVPSTDLFTVVHSFSVITGSVPVGSLVPGPDGQLYGLTSFGGTGVFGTLYRFDPLTFQRTTLYNFANASDGGQPRGEPLVINSVVGIDEANAEQLFTVAPNPSAGETTLKCQPGMLPMRLRVTDAIGRTVHEESVVRTPFTMDLGASTGILSISLTGATGTHTQRVVVQ